MINYITILLLYILVAPISLSHASSPSIDENDKDGLTALIDKTLVIDRSSYQLWHELQKNNGSVVIEGNDAVNRPKFVGLQAIIESNLVTALKQNKIIAAVGIIHTKLPATPLRTEGTITEGLVSPEIMRDKKRLDTVLTRPNIIRNFLAAGGRIVSAYPSASLKENVPGIQIFDSLQQLYKNNLVNYPMKDFSDEYTGATYLIKEKNGKITCFSIMATQANNPISPAKMGIWFGELNLPKVSARFKFIDSFLSSQGMNIKDELVKSEDHIKQMHI
jgi:hypothetical protein